MHASATPVVGLVLLAAALLPPSAAAQSPRTSADTVAAIDRAFARYSTSTPGCAVGVARGGQPLATRAYGLAELEHRTPVTPATIFEAGSVSKQVTAFVVLLLEQEGRISIDDPLRKYLPELPDFGAPLTIRQVLSHTSGLRDWYGTAEVRGLDAYEHHFRNEDLLALASRQRALNFTSGSEYLYSNTGWNLLALVIERVTGESFQAYSQRKVFEPLGMTSSRWRDDYRLVVPGRAAAYAPVPAAQGGGWRHQMPFMSIVGAGGMLTTVHDLLRWNENLTTGRVGGRELVQRMATPARLTSGRAIHYGLGLRVAPARGTIEVGHGGSTGGYRAQVLRFPERGGLSIAVLCNEAGANAGAYANAVADVFLGASSVQLAGAALSDADAQAIRGRYRLLRTDEPVDVAPRDGRAVVNGYHLSIADRDGSAARRLLGVNAEGDSVTLERVAPWTPDANDLDVFTGTYTSDEAAPWHVVRRDSGLALVGPLGRVIPLRPVYADAFAAQGLGTAAFDRDAAGKVNAVRFLMGRVRVIRLERRDEPRLVRTIEGFSGPEAVRYDPDQDVWFVANFNGPSSARDDNGYISRLRSDGAVDSMRFIAGGRPGSVLHAPRGMHIVGDTLWVADVDAVRGFHRRTGAPLASISFEGMDAGFLNDVAPGPDGALYITDTGRNRIYRARAGSRPAIASADTALGSPNGITFDRAGNRMVVVPYGGAKHLLSWVPGGAPQPVSISATGGRYDGVEVMADGRIVVASQADSTIHLFDGARGAAAFKVAGRPADIALDARRKRVAIPYIALNRVEIWELP